MTDPAPRFRRDHQRRSLVWRAILLIIVLGAMIALPRLLEGLG